MRTLTAGRETAFEQAFSTDTETVTVRCAETEWVCYWIKPETTASIPAGAQLKFLIVGTQNQVSKTTLGNWYAQTQVSLTSANGPFNNID